MSGVEIAARIIEEVNDVIYAALEEVHKIRNKELRDKLTEKLDVMFSIAGNLTYMIDNSQESSNDSDDEKEDISGEYDEDSRDDDF